MKWENATNEQIWTILRADIDCPLPLLEGAFLEALEREMIEKLIISVIKKKRITPHSNKIIRTTYEDLIQVGYEASLKAMKLYQPGRGRVFTSFLFLTVSQAYGKLFQLHEAQKRKGKETSEISLYYLMDRKSNVEKMVLDKLELEEKISRLNEVQKEIFKRFFLGFSCSEIAEQMNSKKNTIASRLQQAFILMTGHKINLVELGLYERASLKRKGVS